MKKERSDIWYSFILVPADGLALFLAGLVTWYLRFETNFLGLPRASLKFSDFIFAALVAIPVYLILFALARLYVDHRETRFIDEVFRVALAVGAGTLTIIVILFVTQSGDTSRFLVLVTWIMGTVFVSLARYIVRLIERMRLRRGLGVHRVVLIGDNPTSRILRKNYRENPEQGVRVIEVMSSPDIHKIIKELELLLKTKRPTELIQTDHSLPQEDVEKLLDFADRNKLRFKFTPNLFETQATNVGIATVAGLPIVELKTTPLEGWGRVGKRILDILGALLGLVTLSPVFFVVALLIKLDSDGPIFYKDLRVNRDHKFYLYKFRSMIEGADALRKKMMAYNERTGPMFKIKNDPRITRVGRILRRTSLDELPQLFNVLMGQMSLVGPRPHRPDEIIKYKKHHRKLLSIKPGLTGLAAISGRSDLDFEEEVRLDTYYIEHWSLLLDLKIIIRTIPVALSAKSAA